MDIAELGSLFFGIFLLLLCSAFFSGSETALSALTHAQVQRMKREKKGRSTAVFKFLDEPRRLFITVLFGNTLVNMAFVTMAGAFIYDNVFGGQHLGAAYLTAILAETLVLLVVGEITPKTLAIKQAERISWLVAPPLWAFSRLIYPFRRVLRIITDGLLPLFGVHGDTSPSPITSDEIRATVAATEEGGAIDKQEGELIASIFELQDTKVREIMVPRTKMVCSEVSESIGQAFEKAMKGGYSRLPVYRKRRDNICGIFYVKDLPRWKSVSWERLGKSSLEELTLDDFLSYQDLQSSLHPGQEKTLIREPFFVFETRDIGSLLREMTQQKQQMAILLDEYGGVVGLATAEDIVEEVVGEIEDEYDTVPGPEVVRDAGGSDTFLVPGSLSLRSLNRRLRLDLDVSQADTVGGYITNLSGTFPRAGDVLRDSAHGLEFEVLQMAGNRIKRVRVRRGRPQKPTKPGSLLLLPVLFCLSGMAAVSPNTTGSVPGGVTVAVFIGLLLASLGMMGFFAGSETAVVSASKARVDVLALQSDRRADFIKRLMEEPDRMLGTVLVGTNLMGTSAGVAGLKLTRYVLPGRETLQEVVNTFLLTFVILLFCEILPKTIFRARADDLALRSASALRLSYALLRPVVILLTKFSNLVLKFSGREDREERVRIMREELKLLAEMGEKHGALKKTQIRMIHGILDLEERTIGKIMTPLVDMVALPESASIEELLKVTVDKGYSRIPVYSQRVDNIVGVVNVLDVLYARTAESGVASFMRREIRYEPESRRVLPLLREMTLSRNPMVFVVDEYGGVVGLVTIEDLVEEVMGDIYDEKDKSEEEAVTEISDGILDCDGKTEIQMLHHDFNLSIPEGDYNTIAGYVIEKMQKIPRRGESVTAGGLKILILEADSKCVRRVRILKI